MKETKEKEGFKPITITLETEEEAQYLWHALNVPRKVIQESTCSMAKVPFPRERCEYEMFETFNKIFPG